MAKKQLSKSDKPRALVFDIETAPMLGYVWSLWQNDVGLNQLAQDWSILSWSAKWLDDDYVYYMDQRDAKDLTDEKAILKELYNLLVEADILITHNGKKFDVKKLNARFIHFGLKPVGKKLHIDTYSIARRHFAFTSNKLEYLTDKFCVKQKKSTHKKFPGFKLWSECLKGNLDAWNEMEAYNIMDVLSLEELYYKMLPWDNTVNFGVFTGHLEKVCGCGSTEFHKRGFTYTKSGKFQLYSCKKCGSHQRDHKNLLSNEKRKTMGRV